MKFLTSVSLMLFLASSASAQESSPTKMCDVSNSCASAGSQAELKDCIGNIRDSEDQRLNNVFRQLISSIPNQGFQDPQTIVDRLRQSQRNWLVYRDDYCWFRFSTAEGGTIGGLLQLDCECTLTRDKADHLMDDLEAN